MMAIPMTPMLCFAACSVVLGFVYVLLPTAIATRVNGMKWNAGPRDGPVLPSPPIGQRLERAKANFFESYPMFLAAVLVAVGRQQSNHWTGWGAELYVWARLLYIPLYAFGVPYLRSLAWVASVAGIVMILFGAGHTQV
jgi:uncharacterized MAPEG superfamily protein